MKKNQVVYEVGCDKCPKSCQFVEVTFEHLLIIRDSFLKKEPVVCKFCKSVYKVASIEFGGTMEGMRKPTEFYRVAVDLFPFKIPRGLATPKATFVEKEEEHEEAQSAIA